ncbi:MAG: hypothetical protein ACK5KU_01075 [Beutenbergiaceae bacterium]
MTAVDTSYATPPGRIRNAVRLQFINTNTFIWIPLIVLGGAWALTMVIWLMVLQGGFTGDEGSLGIGGGAQAPLWYFLAAGAMSMAYTFPFSQAMSLTRREYFIGTLGAAAIAGAGFATVLTLLGMVEEATSGYGFGGYFSHLPWLWAAGPIGAWLATLVGTMVFFVIGFWFATIYKQWGAVGLTVSIFAVALALLGIAGIITWQQAWSAVGNWFAQVGIVGVTGALALVGAVLAAISFVTLRRMPA